MDSKNIKSRLLFAIGTIFLYLGQVYSQDAQVEISTATGHKISYDDNSKTAHIEGEAKVFTSSGTISADTLFIDTKSNKGEASGNVIIQDSLNIIHGREAIYFWEASTGTIIDAHGEAPPWRFSGDTIYQIDRNTYRLKNGGITSCDLDPPHFRFGFSRAKMINRQRTNLQNPTLGLGESNVLWSPFFSKSLVPKKWTLRIQPGQNSRDGFVLKNTFGYPLTDNSKILLRYDYLERTGHGTGGEYILEKPNVNTHLNVDYLRETPPDPLPKKKRYGLFWNHYQKFTPKLTMNAKVEYKSDQNFGNEQSGYGNGTLIENQNRGLLSEVGLNYQWPRAALRVDMKRQDKFDDSISSKAFVSAVLFPQITLNTVPIKLKYFPFYVALQSYWRNEAPERSSPLTNLYYQRSANITTQINRDFRYRNTTLTPSFLWNQSWKDQESNTATKDVYLGKYTLGLNWRQRLSRKVDLNNAYLYTSRLEKNRTTQDTQANDHGIEQNLISTSFTGRWGRNNRWTLGSGYDLREAPKNDPNYYHSSASRFKPLNFDTQLVVHPNVTLFYRESYSFYNFATKKAVNTPINTAGEIQVGDPSHRVFFSQGFNHSKTPQGQKPIINLTNKLKFFLSSKWYVDFYLSYQAITDGRLDISTFKGNEKTLRVVRDLHCWIFRTEFSQRTGRNEAYFYIDLKTNVGAGTNIFAQTAGTGVYPYRNDSTPLGDIFPHEE